MRSDRVGGLDGDRYPCRSTQALADSASSLLHPTALTLRKSAPNTEPLVIFESVFQALNAYFTGGTYFLGLAGGAALLWEERLRIGLCAQCSFLTSKFFDFRQR